jgi:hypothetical protein
MFGQLTLHTHPKQDDILNAISKRARHPQKLRSPALLSKGSPIMTPRFGGRTVYLWIKSSVRVWVDKTNVWETRANFPKSFMNGTLLQAEMYRSTADTWVIAFEDVLIQDGNILSDTTPFIKRLTHLISLVSQLRKCADPAYDPGIYAVKQWYPVSDANEVLRAENYHIQPEYLLIRFLQRNPASTHPDNGLSKDPFFMKIQKDIKPDTPDESPTNPAGSVFLIRKNTDTLDPDQYDLIHPTTKKHIGSACVRTLHNSLWLRSLEPDSKVLCRWLKEHSRFEPYADTSGMTTTKPNVPQPHTVSRTNKRISYTSKPKTTSKKQRKPGPQKVKILLV